VSLSTENEGKKKTNNFPNEKKEQTRWNSENLRNKQKMHQYRQLLHHKLQDKQVQQNINQE
jgi:hypothetical protein